MVGTSIREEQETIVLHDVSDDDKTSSIASGEADLFSQPISDFAIDNIRSDSSSASGPVAQRGASTMARFVIDDTSESDAGSEDSFASDSLSVRSGQLFSC